MHDGPDARQAGFHGVPPTLSKYSSMVFIEGALLLEPPGLQSEHDMFMFTLKV